jgi:hypothetical protein
MTITEDEGDGGNESCTLTAQLPPPWQGKQRDQRCASGFGIHINPGYHGGYRDERISCRTGRRIVGRSGFRRVRVIECNGGTYTYRAKRGSRHYRISVDAYDGAIVSRRRL